MHISKKRHFRPVASAEVSLLARWLRSTRFLPEGERRATFRGSDAVTQIAIPSGPKKAPLGAFYSVEAISVESDEDGNGCARNSNSAVYIGFSWCASPKRLRAEPFILKVDPHELPTDDHIASRRAVTTNGRQC